MQRLILFVLFLCLSLSACGGKNAQFYILQGHGKTFATDSLPRTSIGIRSVNIPDYLDQQNIVLRDPSTPALSVAQFNVWKESLNHGIQRVLQEDMAFPLYKQGFTMLASQDAHIATAYSLIIDIVRFDASTDGRTYLDSRWTLIDDKATTVIGRGSFTKSEDAGPLPALNAKQSFEKIISSQSRLLQSYAQHLVGCVTSRIAR